MISFTTLLKDYLRRRGWHLRRTSGLPGGIDLRTDVARLALPARGTIFDIGAHHGETALAFAQHFPEATIHSFEPVRANFGSLRNATAHESRIRCVHCAVGNHTGVQSIELRSDSQTHTLRHGAPKANARYEQVTVTTVDAFMQEQAISHVFLLKADTEGFELPVLRGAEGALRTGSIDLILLEASLDPADQVHSSLVALQSHLARYDIHLAALYDQAIWPAPPRLAYFNALFVRAAAIR